MVSSNGIPPRAGIAWASAPSIWAASTSRASAFRAGAATTRTLATETAETATLGVLQLDDVLVLAVAPGPQELAVNVMVGTR